MSFFEEVVGDYSIIRYRNDERIFEREKKKSIILHLRCSIYSTYSSQITKGNDQKLLNQVDELLNCMTFSNHT